MRWTEWANVIPNRQYWTIAHQAVALTHLGRRDEARNIVRILGAEKPDFSITFARRKLFYLKRPEQLKLYFDGLSLAGVPEN